MIRRLFSTSLSLRVDPASLKGFNMMTKMLRKQQKAIDLHKQRQQNNQKPPPPKSKPNKLKFQDTEKTRNFNSLFHENILLVLHNQTFHHYFKNSGLTITKVRVTPSFSDVYVYWKSRNTEAIEELYKILDSKAGDIRFEMEGLAVLGRIPRITFVHDSSQSSALPSAKEIEEIMKLQMQNSETHDPETDEKDDVNQEYLSQITNMQSFKKRTDVLGFDRQSVMENIQRKMNSYRPINERES